ncbi:MAG: GGDEF domain-containing protein [Gammaproteobacteria bacterium]|nr:GGDEF domain-containing protein [Gammaproteobacteria bacterium]
MHNKITILGVLLAIIYWIVDAFIYSLFSEQGTTFLQNCFNPRGEELWMRAFVVLLFLIFSAYTERLLAIIHDMTLKLKKYHFRLELTIAELEAENIEHQRLVEELEKLSITDPLTSIYNRRKFNELLATEIERSKRYQNSLSIIMCDIDHFKKINDTFGHDVGDRVIRKFSKQIHENIREIDMFARWGGEEFMILMPNVSVENAHSVAEKLRTVIEKTEIETADNFTASFGVADLLLDDTAETFIKRADQALYKAKRSGRNRVESIGAEHILASSTGT